MDIIGCDVAKDTLDFNALCAAGRAERRRFHNDATGHKALLRWLKGRHTAFTTVAVVMEATGVYHLALAAFLTQHSVKVYITNPGRARAFAHSQNQLNKSDPLDAYSLRRYGESLDLQRCHAFTPDPKEIQALRALLSRSAQLDKDHRRELNRLEKCTFLPQGNVMAQSIRRQLRHLARELARIDTAIATLIKAHPPLNRNAQLLRSIKGIGEKTARWLLPLLHQPRFKNARQLAAFLGLTPCHESSGKLTKPGRLSQRGARDLRARLYLPAVAAKTHDPALRAFHDALIARGAAPKQALTAVMRKLVHIAFGVIKHQTEYDPHYAV